MEKDPQQDEILKGNNQEELDIQRESPLEQIALAQMYTTIRAPRRQAIIASGTTITLGGKCMNTRIGANNYTHCHP